MTKDHWKALAIALAAVAIVTNAGAYYTRRALEAELAEARNHARQTTVATPVEHWEQPSSLPAAAETPPVTMPAVQARSPQEGEQCIGGELFRKRGSEWEQLHVNC